MPRKSLLVLLLAPLLLSAQSLPRLINQDGRFQFLVDDKPFLLLGAQVHNSSGWPAELETIWPQAKQMGVNTLEIPIYWEDFEPQPGQFNYETLDAVVTGARAQGLRLVLLWFATWKNGNMDYAPAWVKEDTDRYPRMIGPDGKPVRVLSPHSSANRDADRTAFEVFMRRIKEIDEDHRTVIMVQVQNEPGSLFIARDYSDESNRAFVGPVPGDLVAGLGKTPGTWKEVFGQEDAEEAFAAYHVASYVNQVAEAGKAIYPLPMSVNVWLRERKSFERPGENYPSGGATYNMLDLWKATAPSIDVIAPDIYVLDYAGYREVCDSYRRPDNPLMVPETGGSGAFARYMFYAVGDYDAIGFAPFGFNRRDGTPELDERLAAMAANFKLLGPAGELIAGLQGTGKLQAAAEEELLTNQLLQYDDFDVLVQWGNIRLSYGGEYPSGTEGKTGRVLIGQSGANEFYVMGFDSRINFRTRRGSDKSSVQFTRVEEGTFDNGQWVPRRLLNGDQTFFGLRLPSEGKMLRVELNAY